LNYLANTQTDRQTKSGKNITSLAEVIKRLLSVSHHKNEIVYCDPFMHTATITILNTSLSIANHNIYSV